MPLAAGRRSMTRAGYIWPSRQRQSTRVPGSSGSFTCRPPEQPSSHGPSKRWQCARPLMHTSFPSCLSGPAGVGPNVCRSPEHDGSERVRGRASALPCACTPPLLDKVLGSILGTSSMCQRWYSLAVQYVPAGLCHRWHKVVYPGPLHRPSKCMPARTPLLPLPGHGSDYSSKKQPGAPPLRRARYAGRARWPRAPRAAGP